MVKMDAFNFCAFTSICVKRKMLTLVEV